MRDFWYTRLLKGIRRGLGDFAAEACFNITCEILLAAIAAVVVAIWALVRLVFVHH